MLVNESRNYVNGEEGEGSHRLIIVPEVVSRHPLYLLSIMHHGFPSECDSSVLCITQFTLCRAFFILLEATHLVWR